MVDTARAACEILAMLRCRVVLAGLMALFALFAGTPSTGLAQESAAHVFCRMSWASQPDQLSACIDAQIAGAKSVVRWLDWAKTSGDPAALFIIDTFETCQTRWSPDYQQIDACLRAGSPLSPPDG